MGKENKIALIPLDERPCNYEAEITDCCMPVEPDL
ncbi:MULTISPECIES: DUF4127 family protein [Paenibacillus]|nr:MULTISPECIES: DUF4127 family protein [Paenibacillus]